MNAAVSLGPLSVPARSSAVLRALPWPLWFTVGFLLLQATWIVTVPPFRGSDEFDHAYRAAAVARGDWIATSRPADGRGLLVAVPEALVTAAHAQCEALAYTGPDNCSPAGDGPDGLVLVASGAGNYHPILYWIVGTTALPLDGAGSLYAMRIATALLCAAFMAAAAWSVARWRGSWGRAGLVLAATPVFIYSTTVASAPNGVEMAAAAAFWASLLALVEPAAEGAQGRKALAIAVVSGVVLSALRLLGPLFVLAIAITVVAWNPRGSAAAIRRFPREVVLGSVLIAAATAALAWWVTGPGQLRADPRPDGGSSVEATKVLLLWPLQTIAAFPFRNQAGAAVIYPIVGVLVLGLLVAALRYGHQHARLVLLGSFVAALVIPLAATMATMNGRGVIWQGRYGLPFAIGFVLMAGAILGSRRPSARIPRHLSTAAMAVYGVGIGACLLKVRADELDNQASSADSSWHAPSPVVLVVLVVLAMAAFAQCLSVRSVEHE